MNIAILTEFFPSTSDITGGVESRAYHVSRQLSQEHNIVIITSRRTGEETYKMKEGMHIYRVGPAYPYTSTGHIIHRMLFSLSTMLRLPGIARKHNIDIVDAYSFFSYPAVLPSQRNPHLTYHESWLGQWRDNTGSWLGVLGEFFERMVLGIAKMRRLPVTAVSSYTADKLKSRGLSNIAVIPNGIDIRTFQKIRARTQKHTICYAGRLVEHKRIQDLLSAFEAVKKKVPDAKLDIIGEGPYRKTLENMAENIKDVTFHGFLKMHSDVARHMKSAQIFCHPGTVEGFGITLIESMACGTPYVCSDIPVFREVTKGGEGGLLFSPKDPKDLADKLLVLLKDKKLYRKKEKEAEELATSYRWQRIAEDIVKKYQGKAF